ncbi:DNA polymerase III subunit epsilon [Alphaproteobacteria bacterium]|nr:DNA polymerase III subunit epsilon [Alphaproteobacteria bacterium]
MREVVLDTETTGLSAENGDRVVEIGCLELTNHMATGRTYHCYVNPEVPMPSAAEDVHGLSDEFLANKPLFAAIVDEFLAFAGEDLLIIHNAAFDMGFINAELKRLGKPPLPAARAVDTVSMARQKFPGAPASLDALCRRFSIDNSARTRHGALLDAELLAEVYLELCGGRQPGLVLEANKGSAGATDTVERIARQPRTFALSDEEEKAHQKFITNLTDPIWNK